MLCLGIVASLAIAWAGDAKRAEAAYGFRQVGTPNVSRFDATAHLLENGKVVVFDGNAGNGQSTPLVELYDPETETFSLANSMITTRSNAASVALSDGRLLVAGGSNFDVDGYFGSAELFDPGSGTWSSTGSLNTPRIWASATRLNDGRVLVAGGLDDDPWTQLVTAEIYNPLTGTFTTSGTLSHTRVHHTATLLLDGRVLITGGEGETVGYKDAEIYNPATGQFTPTGSMNKARWDHHATRLADGRVLITGGTTYWGGYVPVKAAEIYDPKTGKFTEVGSPRVARWDEEATLINDGRVILTGTPRQDYQTGDENYATEIFDPATGKFYGTWSMLYPRTGHNAVALKDDKVLILNGYYDMVGNVLPAEILDPPPPPVNGESVNVRPTAGTVAVKCGNGSFRELEDTDQIRVGCQVDTRNGTAKLITAKAGKGNQFADFRGGRFKVDQKKGQDLAVLSLNEPMNCRAASSAALVGPPFANPRATASALRGRRLWGSGKGKYKTKGKRGTASVGGTEWLVEDRCDGTTFFKVKSGVVTVRDFAKKKTIKLTAGKTYVAGKKPKRSKKNRR